MNSQDAVTLEDDPEDILSASLQSLYGFSPITFSTAGSLFTYSISPSRLPHPLKQNDGQIELITPDTELSNWSLHASSIWVSSLFIADHVEELHINAISGTGPVHVLELGAGAGLPSILLAKMYRTVLVTASDYPDNTLIRTLSDNIRRNGVSEQCHAMPYAWGTETGALIRRGEDDRNVDARFDIIVAADTLWNPDLHAPFLDTLCMCLKRGPETRIHLVAGLHTGRYTIQSFLNATMLRGLVLQTATEREIEGAKANRPWDVSRAEGEDERERRRWVVWIILKWGDFDEVTKPS